VYDEVHDEIIAPNPFAEAILFFRGGANGEEAPIRIIQGPHTQLDGGPDWNTPDAVAYDPVYDEVYVTLRKGYKPRNREGRGGTGEDFSPAILVFPRTGNGDVAPLRVLRGPRTLLDGPKRIGVDGKNNLLVIGNREPAGFLIFNRTDDGDVAPKAVISGPRTGITSSGPQQIQMDPEHRQIIAAIREERLLGGSGNEPGTLKSAFVGVWNYTDNGDVPPKAVIRGPKTQLVKPGGLAINPKDKEIYVTDIHHEALFTYRAPHIFGEN
jgi:DNA-binding beta-propeller fold protein YncE